MSSNRRFRNEAPDKCPKCNGDGKIRWRDAGYHKQCVKCGTTYHKPKNGEGAHLGTNWSSECLLCRMETLSVGMKTNMDVTAKDLKASVVKPLPVILQEDESSEDEQPEYVVDCRAATSVVAHPTISVNNNNDNDDNSSEQPVVKMSQEDAKRLFESYFGGEIAIGEEKKTEEKQTVEESVKINEETTGEPTEEPTMPTDVEIYDDPAETSPPPPSFSEEFVPVDRVFTSDTGVIVAREEYHNPRKIISREQFSFGDSDVNIPEYRNYLHRYST